MSDIKLGCHVGMAGKDMFLASAREAASYGANVFMLYTGAPHDGTRIGKSRTREERKSLSST